LAAVGSPDDEAEPKPATSNLVGCPKVKVFLMRIRGVIAILRGFDR
jgi:hypothetical protein